MMVLPFAAPVAAQSYDDERRALDLTSPLARSPRLIGMGRLTLVIDDPHNRITLWDFAGNPTGVMEADSLSTVELRPGTTAISSLHDVPVEDVKFERQDLAARDILLGVEAWHRSPGSAAYGAMGNLASLRFDQPLNEELSRRSEFSHPLLIPIVNGRMPYLQSERMRFAIRALIGYDKTSDHYRTIFENGTGQYIDRDADIVGPPDYFTPDDITTRALGIGTAFSYRFGNFVTAALGGDYRTDRIQGENSGGRYDSEFRENRPYRSAQGTLIGRIGSLEWGLDGRGWKSDSKATWAFSLSSGPAGEPIGARGSLYDREEKGTSVRTRVRYPIGAFELGAGFNDSFRQIRIDEPGSTDSTSFNHFRNYLFFNPASDTLVIPDSVANNVSDERAWELSGGVSWHTSNRRGIIGVEYHRTRNVLEQSVSGLGPRRVGWEVRSGGEYAVNSTFRVRAGFTHRREDRDELTKNNEYIGNSITVGAGLSPPGSRWSVETGFEMGWLDADFGDPGRPRESRNQLASRILWAF